MPELQPSEIERIVKLERALIQLEKRLAQQEATNTLQQQIIRKVAISADRKGDRSLILTAALGGLVLALMVGIQVQNGVISYALPSEAVVAVIGAIVGGLVYWKQKDAPE